ncbi:MAG: Flp pilus assembly protein CpaB [Vicinamibacterales bacterium]
MTRIRIFLVLVLALGAGGALAYGTYNYIQNVPVKTVAVPTRPVVVASADLQLGAELRPDDVTVISWPEASVPEGAFAQPSDVVGRGLIVGVVRHEPILPSKLAAREAGVGLPPAIPPGMRAMSVRVNEVIGVAGYVLPGTRVDVLVTASPTESRADMTSKVVLTNVQVLTAGTKIEQTGDTGKPMPVNVVTLLVTPEQAERLTLSSTEGRIQLALRNPLDLTAPPTPGIRPASLLGLPSSDARPRPARRTAPAPAPAPAVAAEDTVERIEVIRGDKRAFEIVK